MRTDTNSPAALHNAGRHRVRANIARLNEPRSPNCRRRSVPMAIPMLGPADPAARSWVSAHWGWPTLASPSAAAGQALDGTAVAGGHAMIGYGFFFTAG